jgi:hypothetical protein
MRAVRSWPALTAKNFFARTVPCLGGGWYCPAQAQGTGSVGHRGLGRPFLLAWLMGTLCLPERTGAREKGGVALGCGVW